MAGAEARALWQRTFNRCFVQEDAKRAPKLTYYQSSSHNNQSSFMPLHRNPNLSDRLPHNTMSWGHHHIRPNQKEQVNKPLESSYEKKPESFQESIDSVETREYYDESYEKKLLNEIPFDASSPWNPLSNEKSGPWWRNTDKDELASLVAQKSLDYVENCDLPTPQKMKRSLYGCFDSYGFRDHSVSSQTIHEIGPSRAEDSSESDLSKTELLEALRRSQTRAREAENMAKEANAEKDHLVKLLFKQASELFGYKQCIQLLQLEALYFKIKNKNNETPPVSIPWRKPGRKKRSKRSEESGAKYAVGLALGMSLVGAGLLLGWTVGWMQMLSF
ncbi:unnamed protein product [Cochlearia groenlandica]